MIRTTLFAVAAAAFVTTAAAQNLLIENVTVLSSGQAPRANASVLIRDGRIAQVSAGPIKSSAETQRLDGRGKFLTPGLMDSHIHVSSTPGLPDERLDTGKTAAELRAAYFRQQPRSYLYFGVTQALDLFSTLKGLATFEAQPLHPDLYHCGGAPVVEGYGIDTYLDPSLRYKDVAYYLYEPANEAKAPLPAGADPAAHTPEAVVEQIAKSGALCVKVFIEDGFGKRNDLPLISNASLQRVRTEAHKRGLIVIAHANALDMLQIAVENDVDVLAHGTWNWLDADDQPGVPEVVAEQLREVQRKGIGYQPTMMVISGLGALFDPATLADPVYPKVVPPNVLAWYGTEEGKWYVKMEASFSPRDWTDARRARMYRAVGDQGARAAKYLFDRAPELLLLGSDTPAAPTFGNQPGYNTYREMQMWARAGIPPAAIFAAATLNNARRFHLDKQYGTVEPGKVANLLLLEANPLESATAWGRIDKVILRGKPLDRESLAANAAVKTSASLSVPTRVAGPAGRP